MDSHCAAGQYHRIVVIEDETFLAITSDCGNHESCGVCELCFVDPG